MASSDVETALEISKKYLNLLKSKNIEFNKAYLFGSYAKGNPREYSDIDIAIFAEKWKPDKFEAQVKLTVLAFNTDSRIEPHPFNNSDLEDPDPFIESILEEGKVIV